MSGECQYFDSDRWESLIWNHINSLETIDSFLDKYTKRADIEAQLEQIQTHLELTAMELRDESIEQILKNAQQILSVDPEDVPEVWSGLHDLPDRCPHTIHNDAECCLLHSHPSTVSDEETVAYLNNCLDADSPPPATVAAMTVENLDLNQVDAKLSTKRTLDLRFIDVTGTLILPPEKVEYAIDLRGSSIGRLIGADRTILRRIDLDSAQVHHSVDFQNSVFHEKVTAKQIDWKDCNFKEATFHKRADFEASRFRGETTFKRAVFHARGYFKSAHLETVDFKRATFREKASFKRTRVAGPASFPRVHFGGKASFKYAYFGDQADFEVTTFENEARFWDVRFKAGAQFTDAEFNDVADFSLARFAGAGPTAAYFNQSMFADNLLFNAVECPFGGVSFAESLISSGRISQPNGLQQSHPEGGDDDAEERTHVHYNLAQATVGDVELLPRTDRALFTYFNIERTEFNGFDFGAHRNLLSRRWDNLHEYSGPSMDTSFGAASRDKFRVSPDPYETDRTPTDRLEETYLKAKNGAITSGDSKTASEFFLREMKYRRKNHFKRIWEAEEPWYRRPISFGRWVGSWLFLVTCGYGERPGYTLLTSVLIVLGFALMYASLSVGGDGMATAVDYASFSLQVFVALVLGESSGELGRVATFISSVESFIGAFLIALFVFALTRSVHR